MTRQLAARFLPQPQVIKKRIESLIGAPGGGGRALQTLAATLLPRSPSDRAALLSLLPLHAAHFVLSPPPRHPPPDREFLERDATDRSTYVYLA